jgi:hypothetical protein
LLLARPNWRALRALRTPEMTWGMTTPEWSAFTLGILWMVGGFALTVFLPVRSSLYACFPSAGAALATAAILTAAWRGTPPERRTRLVTLGLILPFLLWPVYHARNRRSVEEADLSATVIDTLKRVEASTRISHMESTLQNVDPTIPNTVVVLEDDRRARPSLDTAFGTLIQEAVDVTIDPRLKVWIDPAPTYAAAAGLGPPPHPDVVLELRSGRLERRP